MKIGKKGKKQKKITKKKGKISTLKEFENSYTLRKLPLNKEKHSRALPSLNAAGRHASSKEYNQDTVLCLYTEEELARVCTFRKEV